MSGQRLRGRRGSAADPLNLLQVMLAKGAARAAAIGLRPPSASSSSRTDRNQRNVMIATKDSFEPHSSEQLPNSKRVYVEGTLHKDVRVPMREIELTPTKSHAGTVT